VCRSDLALIYNDRAVLENYHVSAVFKLMKDEACNIISGLKKDEYKYVYIDSRHTDIIYKSKSAA
jgi:3'5'-cyclic nucleotide phosphodiesterase